MADVTTQMKNEFEITIERLRSFVQENTDFSASISPFVDEIFHTDADLYDVYTRADIKETDSDLLQAIQSPTAAKSEYLAKIVQQVNSKLLTSSKVSKIEFYASIFNRHIEKMQSILLDKLPVPESKESQRLKVEFIRQFDSLALVRAREALKDDWIAYPLFFKRYIEMARVLSLYIVDRMEDLFTQLDRIAQEKHRQDLEDSRNAVATPKSERTALSSPPLNFRPTPISQSGEASSTDVKSHESTLDAQIRMATEKYQDDIKSILMILPDNNDQFDWNEFWRTNESRYPVLRNEKGIEVIKGLLADRGYSLLGRVKPAAPTQIQRTQAELAVKQATLQKGQPLSETELTQMLFELGTPYFSDEDKVQLTRLSQTIAQPSAFVEKLSSLQPSEVFEQYLDQEVAVRKNIETYATVAAYLEFVPPELLARLEKEIYSADPKIQELLRSQLPDYFNAIQLRERATMVKLTGGSLAQYLQLKGFDNPEISSLIAATDTEAVKTLAELTKLVKLPDSSPTKLGKILVFPYGKTVQNIANLEEKKKSFSQEEQTSDEFKSISEELAEEYSVLQIKKQILLELAKENQSLLLNAETQELDPSATLAEAAFGMQMLTLTPEEQTLFGSPSDSSDNAQTLSKQQSFLSRLSGERNPKSSSNAKQRLLQTKKKLERTKKAVDSLRMILNPGVLSAGIAGAGVGLTIYSFATNAAVGLATLGGGIIGGGLGFFLGGGIGAGVGFGIGSGIGNAIGNAIARGSGPSIVQTASQVANSAVNAVPGTTTNIASGLNGIGAGAANATTNAANSVIGGLSRGIPLITTGGAGVTAFGATALVGGSASIIIVGTLIATISSNAAFLVDGNLTGVTGESKYVEIKKEIVPPSQEAYDNSALDNGETVTYKITISPRTNDQNVPYVINIKSADDTGRVASQSNPPPTAPDMNGPMKAAIGAVPQTLTGPKSFTYEINYSKSFIDSRITNVFTITFDVADSAGQMIKADEKAGVGASVSFGNPPNDIACLEFSPAAGTTVGGAVVKDWKEVEKQMVIDAFTPMSSGAYPVYIQKICPPNTVVHLYRGVSPDNVLYAGYTPSNDPNNIVLYDGALYSPSTGSPYQPRSVRYTLVHETGHIIQQHDGGIFYDYVQNTLDQGDSPIPTYPDYDQNPPRSPYTDHDRVESLSEAIGAYAVVNNYTLHTTSGSVFNYPQDNSITYNWVKHSIFGDVDPPN